MWSRFSNYVISYTFDWLVQTVCIIWFCCLATVRKAYLCWFGLVLSSQLFFVARQRPDILRHCSHVFLGAVLDSVRTVFLFLELFWLFYGNECTDHKVSATRLDFLPRLAVVCYCDLYCYLTHFRALLRGSAWRVSALKDLRSCQVWTTDYIAKASAILILSCKDSCELNEIAKTSFNFWWRISTLIKSGFPLRTAKAAVVGRGNVGHNSPTNRARESWRHEMQSFVYLLNKQLPLHFKFCVEVWHHQDVLMTSLWPVRTQMPILTGCFQRKNA